MAYNSYHTALWAAFTCIGIGQAIMVLFVLSDFYRGPVIEKVRLQGLEHVLQFTAVDGKIYLRSYR